MSIGAGMFLITAGAIFAFGIRDRGGAVDLNVVGVVMMLAGGAGIWLSYYIANRRRRVETHALDPAVEEEYRAVQEASSQTSGTSGTGRTDTEPIAPASEIPPNAEHAADTATERPVDLDPAASGLHTPTPNRTLPMTSAAVAPSPPVSPEAGEPHSESWRRQILNPFRHEH
jgi:cytoskeletal protein RodZ